MARLWIRLVRRHKVDRQLTVSCLQTDVQDSLRDACSEMDVPAPIWLGKQIRDFETFRHTAFTAENFMEKVLFDRLELEYLDDSGIARQSTDPRNQFDGFGE